ncbi:transposase [Streptomyces sp. 5.8]|uniref:transposase n=1 Tax=Streptomyces sp. 5.8 TaxID=3406571 RepID=UPI003BB5A54B
MHRHHAVVEDRVRTNKAMGLHNLPSQSWTVNRAWMLTANLAADLDAWLCLLPLNDEDGLADAEPDTMRFRLYHLPARLSRHARSRWLRIETTWPWANAFTTAWTRINSLPPDSRVPAPTKARTEQSSRETWNPGAPCSDTRRPHPTPAGIKRGEPITSTNSNHR